MKVKWIISGTPGERWKAVAENEYVRVEAEAENLFEAMKRAEQQLLRETEAILKRIGQLQHRRCGCQTTLNEWSSWNHPGLKNL